LTRNLLIIMGLRVKPAMTQSVFFHKKYFLEWTQK